MNEKVKLTRTTAGRAAALALGVVLLLAPVAWALGELEQKPGTAACVSETGSGGGCRDGTGLDLAFGVATSPDGESVDVSSAGSGAVAVFDRDPATGALSQKPGSAGCFSDTGNGGACHDGTALAGAISVEASPDGSSVYVTAAGSDAVAVLDRAATVPVPPPPSPAPPPPPSPLPTRDVLAPTVSGLRLTPESLPGRTQPHPDRSTGHRPPPDTARLAAALHPFRTRARAHPYRARPDWPPHRQTLPNTDAQTARPAPLHSLPARGHPHPQRLSRRRQHDRVQRPDRQTPARTRHVSRHDHRHRPRRQPLNTSPRHLHDRAGVAQTECQLAPRPTGANR
jgi:hypothetical protein